MIRAADEAAMGASREDTGRRARSVDWITVATFWLCMVVATLDRQVIAIAARAIQLDLHLSDTQLGFVQGPAFAFCAAAAGLPVGWLLDRRNRVSVAAICFGIWSITTSLTAFASSFATLAIARGGGSFGEAGLAPAALSIFADRFPVRTIPRVSALFLTAPFIGAGLGLFIGGVLLDAFTRAMPTLPMLAAFHPWQLVFLTVGCPGVVLAVVLKFIVRDPPRLEHAPVTLAADDKGADRKPGRLIALYIIGMTALVLILFVQLAWLPLRLQRSFGLTAAAAGLVIGPSYIVAGLTGAGLSGWLASSVANDRVLARVTNILLLVTMLLIAPLILAALGNDQRLAGACFFLGAIPLSMALTLAATPIQLLVSGRGRARTLALSSVAFNVVGAGVGPLLPGIISDRLGGHANAIGWGMAVVTTGAALISIAAFAGVRAAIGRHTAVPVAA